MNFNTNMYMGNYGSTLAGGIDTSLFGGNSTKGILDIGDQWQLDYMKDQSMMDDEGFDWSNGLGNFGKFMSGTVSLAAFDDAKDRTSIMKRQSALQEKTVKENFFNNGTAVQNQLNNQAMAQAQMMYGADGGSREAMSLAASNAPQVKKTL